MSENLHSSVGLSAGLAVLAPALDNWQWSQLAGLVQTGWRHIHHCAPASTCLALQNNKKEPEIRTKDAQVAQRPVSLGTVVLGVEGGTPAVHQLMNTLYAYNHATQAVANRT